MGTRDYAPIVLRLGMALVFLWFGVSQLLDPAYFIGYLPQFLFDLAFNQQIVMVNGIIEIVLGLGMLLGFFTRFCAFILALHMLAITIELGYGETAVRDFGIFIGTLAVALHGSDKWCIRK